MENRRRELLKYLYELYVSRIWDYKRYLPDVKHSKSLDTI